MCQLAHKNAKKLSMNLLFRIKYAFDLAMRLGRVLFPHKEEARKFGYKRDEIWSGD